MASGSKTVTMDDLTKQKETLILRLKENSANAPGRPSQKHREGFYNFLNFFHRQAEEINETVKEAKADKELTAKNKKRMDNLFDSMQDALTKQRREAKEAMEDMTESEQEEFLGFFATFTKFFIDLFVWLKDLVFNVIALIKRGMKIAKDFLKGLFKNIFDCIRNML